MTKYILSCSYGKDSLACLGAIEKLGWPLDGIMHIDEWATDDIPAELPDIVEFQKKADRIIKERWNIDVEHITPTWPDGTKRTFERNFYREYEKGAERTGIWGFPHKHAPWCNSQLKLKGIDEMKRRLSGDVLNYVGIAIDEQERLQRLESPTNRRRAVSPLAAVGWTEADARKWCEDNDLLSPVYNRTTRSGCWFCYNQSLDQLRYLRKNYPELWSLMMKWDSDSPITFFKNGRTIHDADKRFYLEDNGLISNKPFSLKKWSKIDEFNLFNMAYEHKDAE